MRWFSVAVFLLVFVPISMAETPIRPTENFDGGFVQRRTLPVESASTRIDRLTWSLLAADGASRVLDAYSTRRMLKNSCSSGLNLAGTSTCNYEQNLPGFIANHASGLSAFEGAMWLSEFTATRTLVHHHHPPLARFIPLVDFLSTTSFAVNNLTLSIGESTLVAPAPSKQRGRK